MRKRGVAIPKHDLPRQGEARGDLSILDTRENSQNRILKLAQCVGSQGGTDTLYEPHVVWMNEDRFVLTGFERVTVDGQAVDFAQSWLCKVELE
jgi:hypothetical protein